MTVKRALNDAMNFLEFWDRPSPPKVIFEAGARDCEHTMAMHRVFPNAMIFAFECNPETLPKCRRNVVGIPEIWLIEKAVYSSNTTIPFYPVTNGNSGASSIYKASGQYPTEILEQGAIEVEAVTFASVIEEYGLPGVDVLWLDMQGAELEALTGLGYYLEDVKLIMCEVEFLPIYDEAPLFDDVHTYLTESGFEVVSWPYRDHWFGNAIYAREK